MGLQAAALAVATIGTAYSVDQQNEAASQQRKAARREQRLQDIKAARERRKQVEQARVARANIIQAGVAQGAGGSSSVISGAGQTATAAGSNISFLDNVTTLNKDISIFNQKAANAQSRAATGQAVSSLALNAAPLFPKKSGET